MRAFRLAYDGTQFFGFQRQPDVPTVEGALFDALVTLGVCSPDRSKPPGYSAAGRTDAGVSAIAQTVGFRCPDWCSPSALNAELPDTVRAWASADVADAFHAIRDARRRVYRYHLHAPAAADDRLEAAAGRLAGTHDFHNLTPDGRGTVREVEISLRRDGDFVVVTASAGGFPRQLVRRLVTLIATVGTGDRPIAFVDRVLGPRQLPGHEGVPPAAAHPLVLSAVEYDTDVDFTIDRNAARSTEAQFRTRRVEHAERSRAAGSIADGLGE